MQYLWWVPCVVLYYAIYAGFSKLNNAHGGKWFWIAYAFGAACPFWVIVSRYSKNLAFDAIVYDACMILSFMVALVCMKAMGQEFAVRNWVGLALAVVGLILMKT